MSASKCSQVKKSFRIRHSMSSVAFAAQLRAPDSETHPAAVADDAAYLRRAFALYTECASAMHCRSARLLLRRRTSKRNNSALNFPVFYLAPLHGSDDSVFLAGCSRLVLLSVSLYALSTSSDSFFFCSSNLYCSALLGSSAANTGAANDVMIAAIARVLMAISRVQNVAQPLRARLGLSYDVWASAAGRIGASYPARSQACADCVNLSALPGIQVLLILN